MDGFEQNFFVAKTFAKGKIKYILVSLVTPVSVGSAVSLLSMNLNNLKYEDVFQSLTL